jgi:hypothetical protein
MGLVTPIGRWWRRGPLQSSFSDTAIALGRERVPPGGFPVTSAGRTHSRAPRSSPNVCLPDAPTVKPVGSLLKYETAATPPGRAASSGRQSSSASGSRSRKWLPAELLAGVVGDSAPRPPMPAGSGGQRNALNRLGESGDSGAPRVGSASSGRVRRRNLHSGQSGRRRHSIGSTVGRVLLLVASCWILGRWPMWMS